MTVGQAGPSVHPTFHAALSKNHFHRRNLASSGTKIRIQIKKSQTENEEEEEKEKKELRKNEESTSPLLAFEEAAHTFVTKHAIDNKQQIKSQKYDFYCREPCYLHGLDGNRHFVRCSNCRCLCSDDKSHTRPLIH